MANLTSLAQDPSLPAGPERRKSPRLKRDLDVDIVILSGKRAGDEIPGKVVNVSKEGLCLQMPPDIPLEEQLSLVVYCDDSDSLCVGKIIWKKEAGEKTNYGIHVLYWSYLDPQLERQLPQS